MTHFVTSDTHFGHEAILKFKNENGSQVRPFASLTEMHHELIERWNSVVGMKDTVHHLGDVAMSKPGLSFLRYCNGRKVLIRGNHDIYSLKDYTAYFSDIRGCFYRDKLVFSHIPLHRDCLCRGYRGNVHGHLHSRQVMLDNSPDPLYFNACVEQHNYTPVALEEVRAYFGL